jgi:hypothetical protein
MDLDFERIAFGSVVGASFTNGLKTHNEAAPKPILRRSVRTSC